MGNSDLLCVNNRGNIVWIADAPFGIDDGYVSMFWSKKFNFKRYSLPVKYKRNTLTAFSGSGYLVIIDANTGQMVFKTFTK